MDNKWVSMICIGVFIGGLVLGWVLHSLIYESQLADIQLKKNLCESKLAKLGKHSVLKLRYDPLNAQAYYLIDNVFNVTFTSIDEYFIRGNITNLTYRTMNKIVLMAIPRYPDGSLDIGIRIEDTEVEVLEPYQTKEFTMFSDVEANQPFDLLLIY